MRDSLTLGRIAGIQIGVNWSWLVVFALIVWTLYSGIFPETNPGLSVGAGVARTLRAISRRIFQRRTISHAVASSATINQKWKARGTARTSSFGRSEIESNEAAP